MGQARTSSLEPKYSWSGAGLGGVFSVAGGVSSGGFGTGGFGINGCLTVPFPSWEES